MGEDTGQAEGPWEPWAGRCHSVHHWPLSVRSQQPLSFLLLASCYLLGQGMPQLEARLPDSRLKYSLFLLGWGPCRDKGCLASGILVRSCYLVTYCVGGAAVSEPQIPQLGGTQVEPSGAQSLVCFTSGGLQYLVSCEVQNPEVQGYQRIHPTWDLGNRCYLTPD